ncbi:MAG: hypothetical protein VW230_01890 [Candidatus Poseidoniales archaeon]
MSNRDEIELHAAQQDMLHDWRNLFESMSDQIETFEAGEAPTIAFEVDYERIASVSRLQSSLTNWPGDCLEHGGIVLSEQFRVYNHNSRPILRITNFPANFNHELESLRMRDRSKIITAQVKVKKTREYMGWLKTATYTCSRCQEKVIIKQRLGRNRESPLRCRPCFNEILKHMKNETDIAEFFHFPWSFNFDQELCTYQDIQYLEVEQKSQSKNAQFSMTSLVREEMVGLFHEGDVLNVAAIVKVDHMPKRNFEKDTRRILYLDIIQASKVDV